MYELVLVFITIILYAYQRIAISIWVMAILVMDMSIRYGNKRVYIEIIEDYPLEDCIKPYKYRFLFQNLSRLSYKDIPKEMYFSEVIIYVGFGVYSFIGFITLFVDELLCVIIGVIYFGVVYGIYMAGIFVMIRKSFLSRFIKLNKHNLKFLFLPENKPYPRNVGKCKVIQECKRGKKVFAKVKILDTGEIIEKVLLRGKIRQNSSSVYSVYEICNVYYIV